MSRKLFYIPLILIIAFALGACAQNPTLQPANGTATSPTASPTPAATDTSTLPTPQPVDTSTPQPTLSPVSPGQPPFDLTAILAAVSSQANVPVDQITLIAWQPVDWRDGCLGVYQPKVMCVDMITPGFSLVFQAGGKNYAVHTDAAGTNFVMAPDTGPLDQLPALSWTRTGGIAGVCQSLTTYSSGNYWLRDCKTDLLLSQGVLPENARVYLNGLLSQYESFVWVNAAPAGAADMFNDRITFYGTGSEKITPDAQQELNATLAKLVGELSNTSETGNATSGITGQALIGPTCGGPVSVANATQCPDKPYPTSVQVLDASGQLVIQFTTDAEGRFHVALQPGSYILHPIATGKFPTAVDQDIQIASGEYLTVTITYDSGIR